MSRTAAPDLDSVRITGFTTGGFAKTTAAISEMVMGSGKKSRVEKTAKDLKLMKKAKLWGVAAAVVVFGANANLRMYIPYLLGGAAALWGMDAYRKNAVKQQEKAIDDASAKVTVEVNKYDANKKKELATPALTDVKINSTGMVGAADKLKDTLEKVSGKQFRDNTVVNTMIAAVGVGIAAMSGAPAAALVGGIWLVGAALRQVGVFQKKQQNEALLGVFKENIEIMKVEPPAPTARTGPRPTV